MKRALSILLATALLLTCIPLGAVSVSAASESDYEYTVSDGKATITGYDGSATELTIPSELGGYPVTTIGAWAFYWYSSLTSVTIGDSITSIGEFAFVDCYNLTAIKVASNNLKYCSLDGVLFNKDKTTLIQCPGGKSGAYTIPDSVTTIGDHAFSTCNTLTAVTLSDSVSVIGDGAFGSCFKLTKITIGNGVKTIGKNAFRECVKLDNVVLPNSVATIGEGAFYCCKSLTSINIPDSVTTIGYEAFAWDENLVSVTIGKKVKTIDNRAFVSCYSLTAIVVADDNHKYCSENGVLFNKGKITLMQYPAGKSNKSYAIPSSVITIEPWAFQNNYYLSSVTVPDSISSIGEGAFEGCRELVNVYYVGTKAQAKKIDIPSYDFLGSLRNATWHYNSCIGKAKHDYTNACDIKCNRCSATRKITHSYKTITKKATTSANGYAYKKCSVCSKTTTKTTIYKASKVSLSTTTYTYNGSAKKPTVTVKDSKGNKIASSNYTVTYASGRKNVGTYKVTIKFKGKYSGTKTLTFKINPAKTTVKSLTAGKKSLKVAITKKTAQVSGYQIQYSTSKSFKSYKTKTLTSYKKTSLTLTGLSAKKTYYIRVRTYKTVNGKKVYSAWSTIKYKKAK